MRILKQGDTGSEVKHLQQRLLDRGFSPGTPDGSFGSNTKLAITAFQRSLGLVADGLAGPATLRALDLISHREFLAAVSITSRVTVDLVAQMFPATRRENIEQHLPFVLRALEDVELIDRPMILMALATIRAETAGFKPISEAPSRFNTAPPGPDFNLYDLRADLGNLGPPDGERFKGRGFIQLTGRDNYLRFGQRIGFDQQLVEDPDLANTPQVAAQLLAYFLKDKERKLREALQQGQLRRARILVNGGSHGLAEFEKTFRIGEQLLA